MCLPVLVHGAYRDLEDAEVTIKHSGAEATDMVGKRWRKFCSAPQDDSFAVLVPVVGARETGVFDAELHRYGYANPDDAPQVETAGVVAVAEDRKPTRREQFLTPAPKGDKRTKAYRAWKQAKAAATE